MAMGICRIPLTASVAPGQQYTFRFAVTVPAAGTHTMKWGMLQTNVGLSYDLEAAATVSVTEDLGNVTFIHRTAWAVRSRAPTAPVRYSVVRAMNPTVTLRAERRRRLASRTCERFRYGADVHAAAVF